MWYYLPVVLLPAFLVIVGSKFFFPHKVTWKEWGLQLGAGFIVTLICLGLTWIGANAGSADFSIFSGQVTGKDAVRVSCGHQYQCGENCYMVSSTDAKGKTTQRRQCDPIYCDEHDYDVDWDVYTTLGTWTIDRVDRQGLKKPKRWDEVFLHEPVHEKRYVSNYLLLNDSRFDTSEQIRTKFAKSVYPYPVPGDYYRYYRVLNSNGKDYGEIGNWLNERLKVDGADKQLNVLLIVTRNDPDFFYAQMEYWRGARKNDVLLFYGVNDDDKVQWSRAMSFADGQNNLIMLKELETMTYNQTFGLPLVEAQYNKLVNEFHRVPNSTFAYMKDAWIPPTWWVVTMSIINLLVAIGIAWFVIEEDVA